MTMLSTLLDRQDEASDDQAKLRALRGDRVISGVPERNYEFARAREQALLQIIQSDDFTERGKQLLTQLGETYALQGRYAEAVNFTRDDARKAEYNAREAAVAALGARLCLCPIYQVTPSRSDAKGTRQLNHQQIDSVYDGSKVITFFRCRQCNALSAE